VEVYSKCGYRLDIIRFETRLNLHSKNEDVALRNLLHKQTHVIHVMITETQNQV